MTSTEQNYGKCKDCGIDIPTALDSQEHMAATMGAPDSSQQGSSHTIRLVKRSRRSLASSAVYDAIFDALCELDEDDFSDAEIRNALADLDLAEVWEDTK